MRTRIYLMVSALMLAVASSAGTTEKHHDDWQLLIDHANVSKWNSALNGWEKTLKQVYLYDNELNEVGILTLNYNTGDTLSRVIYLYDEHGSMTAEYFQDWSSGGWIDKIRYLMDYDEYHRRISLTIYVMSGGDWINSSRQVNYAYNDKNQLISYDNEIWSGSEWVLSLVDNFTYDENGSLVYRIRTTLNGDNAFRIYYYYNESLQRTMMFVQYYQKSNGLWLNSHRDSYYYNSCGVRTSNLRERFVNGSWTNEQKAELAYRAGFPPGVKNGKIPVCHNGHTIYISGNAIEAHLSHGDCIGSCTEEEDDARKRTGRADSRPENPPFVIFPNPARERLTVSLTSNGECGDRRLELLDYNGKLLKVFMVTDTEEITIDRGSLPAGNYYLRLIGKEIYSSMIVFE